MATTFQANRFGYGSGDMTATAPSGSGGVLVVVAAGRDPESVTIAPDTPGDWTSLSVGPENGTSEIGLCGAWWADAGDSPDMTFTRSGSGEFGLFVWRVDDADTSTPSVLAAETEQVGNFTSTENLPDVSSAPDGVAIVAVADHSNQSLTSTSLSMTSDYSGRAGSDEWWAASVHMLHLDGITPGGSTWDAGTITLGGSTLWGMASIVVKTASVSAVDLVVDDVAVVAVADSPTLTQTHQLSVDDIITAVVVDAPTLSHVHELVVSDITVTIAAGTPTLTQTHELVVADTTVVVVIEAPTLTQVHALAVADITVVVAAEAPTLTQVHNLTVDDLSVIAAAESVTLTQTHELVVDDLASAVVIDSPTLSVGAVALIVDDLTAASTVEAITLTQTHTLVVQGIAVASTLDAVTLEVDTIDLAVSSVATATTIGAPALTQVHELVVASLVTTVAIDAVVLLLGPLADDTLRAPLYREATFADPCLEPAIAAACREHSYAITYKGD